MSIFKKWSDAFETKNIDAVIECLHDDYTFVRHQSGGKMNKSEMIEMFRGFMSSDQVKVVEKRRLYENDDVLVEHTVMDFADGTREAVMGFSRLKDGQIIYSETGATLIDK